MVKGVKWLANDKNVVLALSRKSTLIKRYYKFTLGGTLAGSVCVQHHVLLLI